MQPRTLGTATPTSVASTGSSGASLTDLAAKPPIIEAVGFGKTFGTREVLRGVGLDVHSGEIHALVGENGSGKSTFIKILSGYHAPDHGAKLRVRGRAVRLPLGAGAAADLGFRFVHQDLGLFDDGSVLENLLVGRYHTRAAWRIAWKDEARRAERVLAQYGLNVDPNARLASLTEVQRAILAIARAMSDIEQEQAALLVLDEPTARLPEDSVETFFTAVRSVAARGAGVLFVSHRLDEVLELADRVTVLRDGVVVAFQPTAGLEVGQLVNSILGFSLADGSGAPALGEKDDVVLTMRNVSGHSIEGFSADLHRGEILGVTGLVGMGHDVLPHLLFGSVRASAGSITIKGRTINLASITPRQAMRMGIALLPGNRQRDGAVGEASVTENMTLATLSEYFRHGFLLRRAERQAVGQHIELYDVRPAEPDLMMSALSGGNQQKSLVAKWMATRPAVLLLDEPTHGVDVGAKRQIVEHLRAVAAAGTAVLVSSVEADDLVALCGRVLVFRHGHVARELTGDEISSARITEHALTGGAAA